MKIEIIKAPEMTLENFADKHGLKMLITEMATSPREKPRYTAKFDTDCDLRSGIGDSPDAAIKDYVRRISGTHLTIGVIATPWFAFDQTIECPRFVEKTAAPAEQEETDKYKAALEEIVITHAGLVENVYDMQKYRYSSWAVAIAKKALGHS
jgi:hypothetical protein